MKSIEGMYVHLYVCTDAMVVIGEGYHSCVDDDDDVDDDHADLRKYPYK